MSSPVTATSSTPGTPGSVWESFLAGNKDDSNEENLLDSRLDKDNVS